MIAPCSVKAAGKIEENLSFARWSQFVTTSRFSSLVKRKMKSEGKRFLFRLIAWLKTFVLTP